MKQNEKNVEPKEVEKIRETVDPEKRNKAPEKNEMKTTKKEVRQKAESQETVIFCQACFLNSWRPNIVLIETIFKF